ncbi:aldehyde ferredoxin oxidoreductase family protein [Desulfoluna butyratoxydans]|uniref:Aldehyde ferredoxin oxidoreductase c-terminal n=1 Tax=Desulfoluna butyratoxydans TaxID=231438 RepID=A0A4U8YKR2_9BACT|nr:aldehyde ferredoxin oxidoreductase C-terminal domain-containing protein [Desulfoluna butyratoxydans]VFQ44485.1 aldehyde ferredoxin oxidoreductase c-terminal [Desulfoluna butyratoxydans]
MNKILRIDTKRKEFSYSDPDDRYALLGGRALTSRMVMDEVPPTCHPLSADNKIVIAPGLLSGTTAANSGRLSVGSKSPLTGGIKESNAGGLVSQKLARMGIQAIVIEDKPEEADYSLIHITKEGVSFLPADDLVGMTNSEVITTLWQRFGEKVGVACIGPAGEQRLTGASIQLADPKGNPGRAAGRGGLGAVMGSKKIKAMVIDDTGCERVKPANKEAFSEVAKKWAKLLTSHPVSGEGLPGFGTAILVNVVNEAGAMPTKNFRSGRFDKADKISGEMMAELIEKRGGIIKEGCHPGCVIKCSQAYHDKNGDYLTSGFEYETVWAFGAHCLIDDLDAIAEMDRLCDDIGLDTIDAGVAIGMAMEGGLIEWGDKAAAIDLLNKVKTGDPVGKIIGNGAAFTGQALGVDRIPVVKKQALPAYDPRAVKGVGVTYATTPMGADHTAGYGVCQNILKVGGDVDALKKEGNIDVSKNLQVATAVLDAAGLCIFVAFPVLDSEEGFGMIVDMINARYDTNLTADDVLAIGINTLETEKAFNRAAGFTKHDDRLPAMFKENLEPHNVTWDFTDDELDGTLSFG